MNGVEILMGEVDTEQGVEWRDVGTVMVGQRGPGSEKLPMKKRCFI